MSLADLFNTNSVRIAAGTRRVTLVDVETSEEARDRQRRRALEKARAAAAATPKPARQRRSREERLAARRATYAAQRAAGMPAPNRKKPFQTWTAEEREAHRTKQREWYHANRESQLARAKARFAGLTPEQRAERNAKAREWRRRKRA